MTEICSYIKQSLRLGNIDTQNLAGLATIIKCTSSSNSKLYDLMKTRMIFHISQK